MNMHDESEICLIQNDYDDSFNDARVSFLGVVAWPTVVGNGLADVWPLDCFEGDYEAHDAIPSPLIILITEEGEGAFTAHITAEEDVVDAAFFMVATLDEEVPAYEGGMSHLPHHVKVHMTPPATGEPFTLMAGENVDISHTFDVQAGWDYEAMGVAAWVSRPGGTNPSPCPYGDIGIKNEVLQSRWVPTGGTVAVPDEGVPAAGLRLAVHPNPFNPQTTITISLDRTQHAEVAVYDLQGKQIAVLATRAYDAGTHSVVWDGKDATGRAVPSGTYVVQLNTQSATQTRKVMLLR